GRRARAAPPARCRPAAPVTGAATWSGPAPARPGRTAPRPVVPGACPPGRRPACGPPSAATPRWRSSSGCILGRSTDRWRGTLAARPARRFGIPWLTMRERLRFLYGDELGDRTAAELERLLDRFRARLGSRGRTRRAFDQRDAILITYGDTLLSPGRPPLGALAEFASRHLEGRASGVHVLPFFPYSSDYGFSVTDYERVDPALGDWDDLDPLRARFKLMFDFVLNHVSAESEWFQAFLRGEPPYDGFFITVDPDTDLSGVTRPRTTPLLTRFETAKGSCWAWTTFSADQVDLNYRNPQVLLRMIEVML